jgi:hypothetical protein
MSVWEHGERVGLTACERIRLARARHELGHTGEADVLLALDVHEDGQTRIGVAGDQLAVLPLPNDYAALEG